MFINVALHTSSEEGNFAANILSCLNDVGRRYGPLIYDLQSKPSFDNFKDCCMKVWSKLQQNPTLPEMLVCVAQLIKSLQ